MKYKSKTTKAVSYDLNINAYEDNEDAKKFFGTHAEAVKKAKVGLPWSANWNPPEGYMMQVCYVSGPDRTWVDAETGRLIRFANGYFYILQKAPPPELSVNAFPDCCGIKVISRFHHTNTGGVNHGMNVEHADRSIKKTISLYKHRVAILMVALNDDQRKIYHKTLLDNGFKVLNDSIHHPGHGHTITTYSYEYGKKSK